MNQETESTGADVLTPATASNDGSRPSNPREKGEPPSPILQKTFAPISLLQAPLWLRDQRGLGEKDVDVRAFRFDAKLDAGILETSLNLAVDRHPLLRTTFLLDESKGKYKRLNRPVQIIGPPVPIPLVISRAASAGETDLSAGLMAAIRQCTAAFDLGQGPLASAGILLGGEEAQILYACAHRIVADQRSLDILFQDWSACYNALCADGSPNLGPRLPLYAEYSRSQAQAPSSEQAQLDYWKDRLRGPLPVMELPADRSRVAGKAFRGASTQFAFSAELTAGIRALAETENASPQDVCLAALHVLLMRYAGSDDVLVPTVADLRTRAGMEGVVGPFENRIVLRTDLSGDLHFRDALERVRQTVAGAVANQDIPYETVLEAVHPDLLGSGRPAAPVEFQWFETPPKTPCMGGVAGIPVPGARACEVALTLWDDGDAIHTEAAYDAELFDAATIDSLFEHFALLTSRLLRSPDQPLSAISLLTPSEMRLLSEDWNRTQAEYPRQALFHHLVEDQVRRTPEAIAATFADQHISYRELNSRANRLARHLIGAGVQPDMPVGICIQRSLDMVVAVLGIAKAGGAYLPLDPSFPKDRLTFMIEDSQARIVVTERALADRLSLTAPHLVCLDADSGEIDRQSPEDLPREPVDTRRTAYVLYTSGSTGRPKGVPQPHCGVVNLLCDMEQRLGFTSQDRLLSVTTISFDIATMELFLPLVTGGHLILASRADATDGVQLVALLEKSRATVMQGTPSTWQLLLEAGWQGDPKLKIVIGGEALTWSLAEKLLDRCGSFWNQYGPTETTIYSTSWKVGRYDGPVLIGRPISNTRIRILDSQRQPVPIGVPGELCIGGDGLTRGYLHRPDLTSQALIPDPFREGELVYRTGDLARYKRDGEIEYLGRIDHQVKIHGFRIELGEIESVLGAHPDIAETVVVAWEDPSRGKRLVAYVVSAREPKPSVSDLRRFLKEKLADYMVPSAFEWLSALPRTPNGKVHRKALPAPSSERPQLDKQYVAPRNPTEQKLVAVWEEVLGIRPIGITDNYFDLGADSLTTARAFARIEKEFGKRIPPTVLFQAPTAERLAELIQAGTEIQERSCLIPIRTGGTKTPLFLIHGGAGTVLFYYNLAKHLDADRPVYALQARGLYGDAPPDTQVGQMAERYINEIRRIQKTGPYYLGGYCFGGIVAYEMAQRLRQENQEVAMLASLNGPCPRYVNGPGKLGFHTPKQLVDRIVGFYRRLRVKSVRWRAEFAIARNRPVSDHLRDAYFEIGTYYAEGLYCPKVYPGRMVLFKARGLYYDPWQGWSGLVLGGLDAYEIPGAHDRHRTLMEEPAVATLAEKMNRHLDEIHRQGAK